MTNGHPRVLATVLLAGALTASAAAAALHTVEDPGPSPTLGARPPVLDDRTVVLFDGKDFSGWVQADGAPSQWQVQDDGSVLVHHGNAVTRETFGDHQLHVEFYCPEMPGTSGQGRANSGVYVHGCVEVQVLDSYGLEPQGNTCGSIYSIAPALVSASRPPDNWQTYDIVFRAARFDDDGTVTTPAYITVIQNGIVIHNNLAVEHHTPGGTGEALVPEGPLMLQDHGNPIRYRNIWVRRLD